MLDGIDFCHGFWICGIATKPPDGVGGIEDDATLVHHVDGLLYVLSLFVSEHNILFLRITYRVFGGDEDPRLSVHGVDA